YLSPEQIQDSNSMDARADVWALGVILYEMLSCTLPFTSESLSGVLVAVIYDAPPLLTDVPYELAKVVHRCLDKDPDKRPQDMAALAAELARSVPDGARLAEEVNAVLAAPVEEAKDEHPSLPPVIPVAGPPTTPSRRIAARRKKDRKRTIGIAVLFGTC